MNNWKPRNGVIIVICVFIFTGLLVVWPEIVFKVSLISIMLVYILVFIHGIIFNDDSPMDI